MEALPQLCPALAACAGRGSQPQRDGDWVRSLAANTFWSYILLLVLEGFSGFSRVVCVGGLFFWGNNHILAALSLSFLVLFAPVHQ